MLEACVMRVMRLVLTRYMNKIFFLFEKHVDKFGRHNKLRRKNHDEHLPSQGRFMYKVMNYKAMFITLYVN